MWLLNWWKYLQADSNNVDTKGIIYSIHRWYAKKTGYPKPSTILPIIYIVDDEDDDNDQYISMMNMNNETMSIMIHNKTNRDVTKFVESVWTCVSEARKKKTVDFAGPWWLGVLAQHRGKETGKCVLLWVESVLWQTKNYCRYQKSDVRTTFIYTV